jgi:agmatinase
MRTEQAVARILGRKAVPIVLGGDHSITLHAVRAMAGRFPDLDVLHFDAHPDLYTDLYGDRLSHACPMMRIMEEGLAKTLVQAGIRAASNDQRANAAKAGVRMIEMKDIRETPALEFRNPLYVSFDLDALDPAFAPGVSHLEPGGLSVRQAVAIIQALKARIVGFDIVELNAARDPSGITAAAAFKLLKELAGRVVRP